MKELRDIVESIIIDESFQSSILRELVNEVINKGSYKNYQILPRGVAWDKITDKDIVYGESNDSNFAKKFIKSENYFIIWFPLTSSIVAQNSRGHYTIEPGRLYITLGNEFVNYDAQKSVWRSLDTARTDLISFASLQRREYPDKYPTETDKQYRHRVGIGRVSQDQIMQNRNLLKPSVREYIGPLSGHLTVKKLIEDTICSCIAISKETVAKYSTALLIQQRYESKLNATAMLKVPLSNYDVKKSRGVPTDLWNDGKDSYGIVDYPAIRDINRKHYKELLAKSTGIKYIKDIAERCKPIVDAIDKYTKIVAENPERITPSYIKSLAGDQFVNVIFNTANSERIKRIAEVLANLQSEYNSIVKYLENIVEAYIKSGSRKYPKDDYRVGYIDKHIDIALTYIVELKQI